MLFSLFLWNIFNPCFSYNICASFLQSEDSNRFFGLKRQSIPKPEEKEVTVHEGRSGSASVKEESSDDEVRKGAD